MSAVGGVGGTDRAGGAVEASGATSGGWGGSRARVGSARFLHGLNPLAKIAGPLPAMVAVVVLRDVARPVAFILLGVAVVLLGAGLAPRRAVLVGLGLPYRLGYAALAAVRFVSRLRYERDTIRTAHRVRGSAGGGSLGEVRRLALPLLVGGVRHASRVALAMDARGFGAYEQRTERHVIAYRVRDTVFILGFWVVTAAVLVGLR